MQEYYCIEHHYYTYSTTHYNYCILFKSKLNFFLVKMFFFRITIFILNEYVFYYLHWSFNVHHIISSSNFEFSDFGWRFELNRYPFFGPIRITQFNIQLIFPFLPSRIHGIGTPNQYFDMPEVPSTGCCNWEPFTLDNPSSTIGGHDVRTWTTTETVGSGWHWRAGCAIRILCIPNLKKQRYKIWKFSNWLITDYFVSNSNEL